ncbi:MAG: WD40 repeat domain-containing protein [Sulfurimonadaceae bacterium]|nr:WD40 repeat domain-containing protein [Sulfurimonadaceae bacterium]
MPKLTSLRQEASTITMMQRLADGRVGVVTDANGIYLFNPETKTIENHFKIEELEPMEHSTAFSSDGGFFAFAHNTPKGNAVRIIDMTTKALVRSYATQENSVELLEFDPTGTYVIAGTTTGRVFLWRTDGNNLLARLSSFPEYTPHLLTLPTQNFVSAAAFDDNLVATTGYGGSIVVTNVHSQANTKRLKPGKLRIDAMLFLDNRRLITGNEEGVVSLIHTEENHPTRLVAAGVGPIKHLVLLPNGHFLLAASDFNHIALINLETMEVLNNRYITTSSAVRSMTLADEHSVLIGTLTGEMIHVDLSPFSDFNDLVREGRYEEAYALCDKEPFIQESVEYRNLDTVFAERYEKAHEFLERKQREDALHILMPFMKVSGKGKAIRSLFNAFDNFPRLSHLVAQKKYSVAYGLCTQYPHLKKTTPFALMEQEWEKAFAAAQKLVITGHEKQARQAFDQFLTVGEKSPYIRMLLHNKAILIAFAKAVAAKDYIALRKLTEQEPILKQIPSYRSVMESTDTIIEVIMAAIKNEEYDKADLLCHDLLQIPHLAHHHANVNRFITKAKKFSTLHDAGKTYELYEMLDLFTELTVLPLAKKVEEEWNKMMQVCEEAALHGHTAVIKNTLGSLITLPSRSEKIGNLIRISYQMQIKLFLARNNPEKAGRSIERYIDLFGIDNETRLLIKLLNKKGEDLFLTDEQQQNRPRGLWLSVTNGNLPDKLA